MARASQGLVRICERPRQWAMSNQTVRRSEGLIDTQTKPCRLG